jgi:hypothetical protein
MQTPDILRFISDARPDRVMFVQALPGGMKFHVLANAENCPIAFSYVSDSGQA